MKGTSNASLVSPKKFSDIETQVTTNTGDIDDIQTSLGNAESDISDLKSRMTDAESGLSTNSSDIDHIEDNTTKIANSNGGFAAGSGSSATSGVAVGSNAVSSASGAVQLGTGTNNVADTLQFETYQVIDANGKIPLARLTIDNVVTDGSNNPVSSDAVDTAIRTVTDIAEGKTSNYTIDVQNLANTDFNTSAESFSISLPHSIVDINNVSINLSDLKLGDIIWITETNLPDRWVASKTVSAITFYALETNFDIDSVPTEGSVNAVSSGGVYTALAGKQNTLTFDTIPTENSNNPVTSDGIYEALQDKQNNLTAGDNISISGDTISATGVVTLDTAQTITGVKTFKGVPIVKKIEFKNDVDNPTGNTMAVLNDNGSNGKIQFGNHGIMLTSDGTIVSPDADGGSSLGNASYKWRDLYLSGNLSNGTLNIPLSDIETLSADQQVAGQKIYSKVPKVDIGNNLPNTYQELAYIQSNGLQYIDCGLSPTPDMTFYIRYSNTSGDRKLFGSRTSSSADGFVCAFETSNGFPLAYQYADNAIQRIEDPIPNTIHTLESTISENYYQLYYDNILTFSDTKSESQFSNNNIYLFAYNDNGSKVSGSTGLLNIYSFKLFDDNTIALDLVPAKRISDNVIGMYDKVSGSFFTNSGTSNFIAGPIVSVVNVALENELTDLSNFIDDTKLDKTDEHSILYATDASGNQETLSYSDNVVGGDIVQRVSSTGDILVPLSPATSSSATSKKYVDEYRGENVVLTDLPQDIDAIKRFANRPLVKSNAVLPKTYQMVEYLQSTGVQYIDTGIEGKSGYTLETEICFDEVSQAEYINFAGYAYTGVTDRLYYIRLNNANNKFGYTYGESNDGTVDIFQGTANIFYDIKAEMKANNQNFYVNGKLIGSSSYSELNYDDNDPNNIYMFIAHYIDSTTGGFSGKCKFARWYDNNGNLIRNFVPCYRKSDNKPGMYDFVSAQFFTNAGDGADFSYGPNIYQVQLVGEGGDENTFVTLATQQTISGKKIFTTTPQITKDNVTSDVATLNDIQTAGSDFVKKQVQITDTGDTVYNIVDNSTSDFTIFTGVNGTDLEHASDLNAITLNKDLAMLASVSVDENTGDVTQALNINSAKSGVSGLQIVGDNFANEVSVTTNSVSMHAGTDAASGSIQISSSGITDTFEKTTNNTTTESQVSLLDGGVNISAGSETVDENTGDVTTSSASAFSISSTGISMSVPAAGKIIIDGSIEPAADGTKDIGTAEKRVGSAYIKNSIYADGIKLKDSSLSTSNSYVAEISTDATNNINMVTPSNVNISALSLLPQTNNSLDIGSSSKAIKDLYIAGNLSDGTNSISINNIANKNDLGDYVKRTVISTTDSVYNYIIDDDITNYGGTLISSANGPIDEQTDPTNASGILITPTNITNQVVDSTNNQYVLEQITDNQIYKVISESGTDSGYDYTKTTTIREQASEIHIDLGMEITDTSTQVETTYSGGIDAGPTQLTVDVPYVHLTGNLSKDSYTYTLPNKTGTFAMTSDIPTLGTASTKDVGTSSGNVPILDSNGKLASSVLPAIAITNTFVVSTEAAMLALTAEVGDVCVRTDLNKTFILKEDGASTLSHWQEMLTPTAGVTSVNGQTGAVTLTIPTTTDSVTQGSTSALTSGGAYTALNNKMDKTNPTGTGSLSINRKANTTVGDYSVAIGYDNEASGNYSYSEGKDNVSSGDYSHTEGFENTASVLYAHAEGYGNTASGYGAHAEGFSTSATNMGAHAEGHGTSAKGKSQHVFGEYNVLNTGAYNSRGTYVEIVGNGTSTAARSNARTLDWSGNEELAGNIIIKGGKVGDGNNATYKLALPDTTGWTADKTFATTDQIPTIKTLDTTATTAQSTNASEAIAGSGTVTLHKVSKTGTSTDLVDANEIAYHDDTVTTANESTFADNYYTKTQIIDLIYPIGSVFITVNNVNPSTYLPNTNWEAVASGKTLWTTTTDGEGGSEIAAGLPNITGSFGANGHMYNNHYATGAFSAGVTSGWSSNNGAASDGGRYDFNASLSNGIYGNSNTVQPPAIKVYMWKRIPLANS